jgi:hypothetical protein
MNKPLSLLLLIGTLAALTACESEKPYVMTDYRFHQRGIVLACFNEENATIADAQKVAEEVCRQYDRTAEVQLVQPYQCSWRAPTLVTLHCTARPGENPGPILQHGAPMRHDTPLPAW